MQCNWIGVRVCVSWVKFFLVPFTLWIFGLAYSFRLASKKRRTSTCATAVFIKCMLIVFFFTHYNPMRIYTQQKTIERFCVVYEARLCWVSSCVFFSSSSLAFYFHKSYRVSWYTCAVLCSSGLRQKERRSSSRKKCAEKSEDDDDEEENTPENQKR